MINAFLIWAIIATVAALYMYDLAARYRKQIKQLKHQLDWCNENKV